MWLNTSCESTINPLRPRQNGRHFADDIFNSIFLNENVWTLIKISLKFIPKGHINNIPALVEIMAWRRPGDKPLSEPMMVILLTHICITRPQWVNWDDDTVTKQNTTKLCAYLWDILYVQFNKRQLEIWKSLYFCLMWVILDLFMSNIQSV